MTPDEIQQIEAYLRRIFQNERLEVQTSSKEGRARVDMAGVRIGRIVRDDEDEDLSYDFSMSLPDGNELEPTLRTVLGHPDLSVRGRNTSDGSVEVYLGEEFVGVVSRNDGAYEFNMAILDYDLEGGE